MIKQQEFYAKLEEARGKNDALIAILSTSGLDEASAIKLYEEYGGTGETNGGETQNGDFNNDGIVDATDLLEYLKGKYTPDYKTYDDAVAAGASSSIMTADEWTANGKNADDYLDYLAKQVWEGNWKNEGAGSSKSNNQQTSAADYYKSRIEKQNGIEERINALFDKSNKLINDYNERFSNGNTNYYTPEESEAYCKEIETQTDNIISEAKELKNDINDYSEVYESETINAIIEQLNICINNGMKITKSAKENKAFMANFENEATYKTWKTASDYKSYLQTLNYDEITKEAEKINNDLNNANNDLYDAQQINEFIKNNPQKKGVKSDSKIIPYPGKIKLRPDQFNVNLDNIDFDLEFMNNFKMNNGDYSGADIDTIKQYIEDLKIKEYVVSKVINEQKYNYALGDYDSITQNDDFAPSEETIGTGNASNIINNNHKDSWLTKINKFFAFNDNLYNMGDNYDPAYDYVNYPKSEKKGYLFGIDYDLLNRAIEIATNNMGINDIIGGHKFGIDYYMLSKHYELMTDKEKSIYDYLYSKDGKDSADQYLTKLEPFLTEKNAENRKEERAENVSKNAFNAIMASISSIPETMIGGLDAITYDISALVTGNDIDVNSDAQLASVLSGVTRDTIAKKIEDSTNSKVVPFLYKTGMSIADSVVGTIAMGPSYAYIMGINAATNETRRIIENGGTQRQAVLGGIASGVAESLFEKISLGKFVDAAKNKKNWGFIKTVLSQSGVEASEEMATEISNIITNAAIMTDSSDYNKSIMNYKINGGLSDIEARKKAFYNLLGNIAMAGVGGAISGAVMGGGAKVYSNIKNNSNTTELGDYIKNNSNITTLTDIAGTFNSPEIQALSNSIIKSGDNASSLNVGKLQKAVVEAVQSKFSSAGTKAELSSAYNEMASKVQSDNLLSNMLDSAYSMEFSKKFSTTTKGGNINQGKENSGYSQSEDKLNNLNEAADMPSGTVDFNAVAAKTADNGENVTIKGIYSVKSGDVKVALNNGNNVSINNLNITDKVSSVLLRGASKYLSTDTANAYINEFNNNSELPANVYQKAFYEYYRAGLAGVALSSVKSMYADVISDSTKNLAYNSGRADLAVKSGKSGKNGAETVKIGNTAANKSGGVVKAYNEQKLDNIQRSKLRVLDIYSKSKGIKIHVVDDIRSQIRDKNGNTVKVNGKSVNGKSTAVISLKDGAKIYSKVAGHTLFSFSEEFSPEQTKVLRDFVIGELKSDSGYNFDSEVLRYGKINNTTDLNIIYSQMAADLCFDVLNDSAAWNKLINTNKPLAKNLAMWYKQYAADITASVKKQFGSSNGQLAKASYKEAAAISETAGKWNDAVDGASGGNYESDAGLEDKENNSYDNGIEGTGSKIKYFDDVQLKTEPNKAYFWSGMGETGAESAASIAKKNGGVTLETTIEAQGIQLPQWDFNNPSAIKAWQNASSTYAKQVSGEVRAVIGSSVKPDSIWNMVELPALKANPNVTKIITIDPVTQAETIIFTR